MAPYFRRQTTALNLCYYVPWEEYDWYDFVQCNYSGSGTKIHWNPAVYCIITSCHTASIILALDLLLKTLRRFKHWKSLYFW
jgi:hypothetical protein